LVNRQKSRESFSSFILAGAARSAGDLGAGGQDFNLGDGAIDYRTEQIMETYYSIQVWKGLYATFHWQGINNPAYNHDRGRVAVWTILAHFEF
jgi:hypothetical protein